MYVQILEIAMQLHFGYFGTLGPMGWAFFSSEMQDLISEDGWTVLDTPILAEGLGMR